MKPNEILAELGYPLTQPALAMALVFFWVLLSIASLAGLFGLFLLLLLLPAYFRYLLAIVEARTHGKRPDPPTAEMFNLVDSLWTLFPALPVAAIIWFEQFFVPGIDVQAGVAKSLIAALPLVAFVMLMPASLAILTITRSPLASINPLTIGAVISRSLPGYLLIPLLTAFVAACNYGLMRAGVAPLWLNLAMSYQLFLFCSLTGAVMYRHEIYLDSDIPDAIEADALEIEKSRVGERQAVANHAYGFISRGNRAGGLKHVQDRIDEEADVDGAYQWFFDEMMRWESSDAVLYFAQAYLSRVLRLDQDATAIRVLVRCLHRNPRFRPLSQDLQLLQQTLQKHHRDDLLSAITN